MEELGGLGRIEAFQKQSPEADAVFGVARIPRNERFKGSLRFLIAVLFPKRFGLSESWRRSLRREGGAAHRMASRSLICRAPPGSGPTGARARRVASYTHRAGWRLSCI